jgi:tetratricopeptide (TPR) repeat protein
MNRPSRRQSSPTFRQNLQRMSRAQAIFVVVTLLVVCAVVGGSVGTVVVDALNSDNGDVDPEEFNASTRDEFIEEIRATVEANPSDAAAMSLLANVLAQDGRIDEAIDWYEKSLAADPTNAQVRLSFALSLAESDKRADAEVQYRRILDNDPNQAEAWYYLGELYRNWNPPRTEDAIAALNKVLSVAPGSVIAERATASLVAMGVATPAATPTGAGTPVPTS